MTDENLTTDPARPAQRMRAGSLSLTFTPWIVGGILLVLMPFIFTSNSALTIMNQMWITVIFALAYNMLLGQGVCCPLVTRYMRVWAVLPVCIS
ncbi:hypothetical protein [Sulfitobacter sediminilitoris]|uniref:hypothetical protein n=1 Tax=Sulfitobacter sediminilitoris TaxID=2698830 RepID=UPI003618E233